MAAADKPAGDPAAAPHSVADLAGATGAPTDLPCFDCPVRGLDFEAPPTLDSLLAACATTGFQATNLSRAIAEARRMQAAGAKVFFGCTSNIVSSGLREQIRFLAKHRKFDVFVCTAGGIEEDIIKCLLPTHVAAFDLNGAALREGGWNRIGNLVIANENYMRFEAWFAAALEELLSGTVPGFERPCPYTPADPLITTPSAFIAFLGRRIASEDSILYWCQHHGIPVYSPALTDGSIGDMLTFARNRSALRLDIVEDIYRINMEGVSAPATGAVIVGCGLVKHHILNANLFCNGLDYCVLINTASEFDGSDAGASLNEATSWGKVKPSRTAVKVHGDASIILPLFVYGAYVQAPPAADAAPTAAAQAPAE